MKANLMKGAAVLTTEVPDEGGNVSPDFEQKLNARFPNTEDKTPENPNQAFEEKLNRMYGKPEVNTGGGPFGGGPGHINAGTEQPSDSRFRDEGEGDPPETYNDTLGSFFEGREHQARYDRGQDQIEALAQARKGANEVLTAFDVGGPGAKEIFNRVSEYMEHPRSADEIEDGAQQAEAALKKEFGHDYQKMTNAARHVLKEAGKRIPGLTDMLNNTGLGNDVDFIKRLAHIGKRRGFAK
jgi:hypothetical protein